jgi:type IV pilus assembly protein PilC
MDNKSQPKPAATYIYQAKDLRGKKITGEIIADSITLARESLQKQGIRIIKLSLKSGSISTLSSKKITSNDIAVFARQLATMSAAGIALIQALNVIITGSTNIKYSKMVVKIKTELESGLPLSASLSKQPEYFDELFCNLVNSGEQSGTLDVMLDRISVYKERSESLKRKIKKAMYYPIAILIIAAIVTILLLVKVVPTFQGLFSNFGAELPAFTQFVLNLSAGFQKYWIIIFIVVGGVIFAVRHLYKHNKAFKNRIETLLLKTPIIGNIINKACIARFARTLSTTFAAGVPLTDSLISVANAVGNIVYKNALLEVRTSVIAGQHMQISLARTKIFPSMVVQMVAIGEESGKLEGMLAKIASIYEEEVNMAVDGLTSLLEPLIMAILGVLIGGLVIAMYLPIFKLGAAV